MLKVIGTVSTIIVVGIIALGIVGYKHQQKTEKETGKENAES